MSAVGSSRSSTQRIDAFWQCAGCVRACVRPNVCTRARARRRRPVAGTLTLAHHRADPRVVDDTARSLAQLKTKLVVRVGNSLCRELQRRLLQSPQHTLYHLLPGPGRVLRRPTARSVRGTPLPSLRGRMRSTLLQGPYGAARPPCPLDLSRSTGQVREV